MPNNEPFPSYTDQNKVYAEHSGVHRNQSYKPYTHDYHMIAFNAHGYGYNNIDGISEEMDEDDIVLISPGNSHFFTAADENMRMDIYYCCFFPQENEMWEYLRCEYSEYSDFFDGRLSHIKFRDTSKREIRDIFIRLIDEQMEHRKSHDRIMKAYLEILLMKLFRMGCGPEETITYRNNTVDRTIRYINRNIYKQISLEELAQYHHMTTFYLCRTFKKYTGMTIMQYASNMRMERIADLLKNTNRPIEEILEVYDYGASYLKQSFRERYGMSMKEYRIKNYYRGK